MSDVVGAKFYRDYDFAFGPGRKTVMLSFKNGARMSDHDIAELHGMKPKTVSARRTELWRQGFVEPVGLKKIVRQRGQVWAATAAGQQKIAELLNG